MSGSGSACTSRSKVGSPQDTKPSGAFFFTIRLSFFSSSPALRRSRSFSTSWSGACTTTVPAVSKPARPARPATWWNSRALRCRTRTPSYFDSDVTSTVRIGTLMPTPRVSVPHTTLSSPACASVSTSRRYRGSIPAWCTPMPCRTSRDSVLPNPAENRKPPIGLGDRVALPAGRDVDAGQRLRPFEGGGLGRVHDVDRRLAGARAAPRASRAPAYGRSSSAAAPGGRRWRRRRSAGRYAG